MLNKKNGSWWGKWKYLLQCQKCSSLEKPFLDDAWANRLCPECGSKDVKKITARWQMVEKCGLFSCITDAINYEVKKEDKVTGFNARNACIEYAENIYNETLKELQWDEVISNMELRKYIVQGEFSGDAEREIESIYQGMIKAAIAHLQKKQIHRNK